MLRLSFSIRAHGLRTASAQAGQQKWASQYVSWTPDKEVGDIWNVDQDVWVPRPANGSYWPIQFGFVGQNYGGYMGLQQGTDQNVRFSIWNATAAKGTSCRTFDGEGVGYTCTLPVKIDPGKLYRLRLWRMEAEADGQWWGGWLIEADQKGARAERLIGRIKAPVGAKSIKPKGITNFVEYWGAAVGKYSSVPLSIAAFAAPAVNYDGKGAYAAHYRFAGSKKATGNLCLTGEQGNGALISAKPFNLAPAEDGVMMFLGGTLPSHTFDLRSHPTPASIPP